MSELTAEQAFELRMAMKLYRGLHFRELFIFLKNVSLKADLSATATSGSGGVQ